MSKGNLIGTPLKDIVNTIELLDCLGVSPEDFEVLKKASSWSQSIVGRIHRTDPFLWAMLEIEQGAKKVGFLESDFRALAKDEEKLRQVLAFLRVGGSGFAKQHLIDCDVNPFVPSGLAGVESHKKGGQFVFDPEKVRFHLSENQQSGKYILGKKLRKKLVNEPVLNANVLDYLLAYPELIPESWKKDANNNIRYIFFWGTIYRGSSGFLCVRCLYFYGGGWRSGCNWLDYGWVDSYPAALRAS